MEFRIAALILVGLTLAMVSAEQSRFGNLHGYRPGGDATGFVQVSDGLEVSRSVFDPVALPSLIANGRDGAAKFVQAR